MGKKTRYEKIGLFADMDDGALGFQVFYNMETIGNLNFLETNNFAITDREFFMVC